MEKALANESISSVNKTKRARTINTKRMFSCIHVYTIIDIDDDYLHYFFARICKSFAKFETANSDADNDERNNGVN